MNAATPLNEADVREEIASPFLELLGYKRGTSNDILREYTFSYGRHFLGRKKPNDPPLRGRPDYVLSVIGAGRWVLEIKAPSEEISKDVIEQAISYAMHPEISGSYAAIMNGKRLVVFSRSQNSADKPVVDIEITSPKELAIKLQTLLSPLAIRRDCSPPIVDLGVPLSEGLRSKAQITGGFIAHADLHWEVNAPLPPPAIEHFNKLKQVMVGYRSAITGGHIERDSQSRIRAKLEWSVPHDAMLQFMQDKHLLDAEYISLDNSISQNPTKPTIFDVVGRVEIQEGEELFDMLQWKTMTVGVESHMNYRGQASGYIAGDTFMGSFQAEYENSFPIMPALRMSIFTVGNFEVKFDSR